MCQAPTQIPVPQMTYINNPFKMNSLFIFLIFNFIIPFIIIIFSEFSLIKLINDSPLSKFHWGIFILFYFFFEKETNHFIIKD